MNNQTRQGGQEAVSRPGDMAAGIAFGADLPPTLFSDIAAEKARLVAQGRSGNKNNSTQLRRFYDELVMWNEKVQLERGKEQRALKYAELAPFIKMLIAKVAYAKARGLVDERFETMFSSCLRKVNDAESLKHCKLFMEAFMGFYKAQEKDSEKAQERK